MNESLEGWLYKKGDKGLVKTWKHRYFRQHKDQLMYFRSDTTQESLGFIPLSDGKISIEFFFCVTLNIF